MAIAETPVQTTFNNSSRQVRKWGCVWNSQSLVMRKQVLQASRDEAISLVKAIRPMQMSNLIHRSSASGVRPPYPNTPCSCVVYTMTPQLSHGNPFKARVYTLQLHGVCGLGSTTTVAGDSCSTLQSSAWRSLARGALLACLVQGICYGPLASLEHLNSGPLV